MKYWITWLFIVLLSACSTQPKTYQEQAYVFGTLVEISVYGESEAHARQAVAAAMQELQRLHNMLHAWQPSELSNINQAFAQKKSIAISPEMHSILQDAQALSQQSQGLFNPAIGGLIQLWGFQSDEFKSQIPDASLIEAQVQQHPNMQDIVLADNSVSSRNPAVRIDLGGYGKGYALDRAAQILRQQGIHHALLNFGGNLLAIGQHGERPWRVGIQHPRKSGPLATLDLHDGEALGTSGDYQRYFMFNQQRFSHLLDPRTGYPAQGVQAVTVLTQGGRAGVLSDVVSKPLFLSGVKDWQAASQQMRLNHALLVDAQGSIYLTAAMQKRLEFADKQLRPQIVP